MYRDKLAEFYKSCEEKQVWVPPSLYWYHCVELGNGLVTPGVFDFREFVGQYCFPENMDGLSVLDIGAATGFFSFEFVRRGAMVTATELPSLRELDLFPGQTFSTMLEKAQRYILDYVYEKPEELTGDSLYRLLLADPFEFCCSQLKIRVNRKFVSIYDLTSTTLGRDQFDWVFLGDVLLHTLDPLKALTRAASMCKGTLVVAQHLASGFEHQPVLLYTGGENPHDDSSAWWCPTFEWYSQVLKKLGFAGIEIKGEFEDTFIPNDHHESKTVIHATRA